MQKTRSTLLVILMMTAALAGCISEDTSDLDTQIEDLDTQNTELTQTIAERDLAISELEATIAGLESNVAGLEASIPLMEEQRDALLALLSDSQEFANQTLELAEAMNETIAALHVMLGENATQVLQLQTDVLEWQQTAESNRAVLRGAFMHSRHIDGFSLRNADMRNIHFIAMDVWFSDFTGSDMRYADFRDVEFDRTTLIEVDFESSIFDGVRFHHSDLTGANLTALSLVDVTWNDTICPDGTNSDNNGYTCENNL
jgi:uncharacterized protein YjbI with pentapeptide repeats